MPSRSATVLASVAVASLAVLAPCPSSAVRFDDYFVDAQKMPETVGIPRDPATRANKMAALAGRLASRQPAKALDRAVVVELSPAELRRIDEPGAAESRYFVGIARPLALDVDLASPLAKQARDGAPGATRSDADGATIWTAAFAAPGATALRLHLSNLDLPRGAELYVYNLAGQAFGPYTRRGPVGNGELYTNTVFGDRLMLQLSVPADVALPRLHVADLGVMGKRFVAPRYTPQGVFDANDLGALAKASNLCSNNASCVVNAACQSSSVVNVAKDAVASMLFQSGGSYYICTGGLIADNDTTTVKPYFLTAHHCIGSSGEASSLETYFDYQTTCSNPNCTQPYNNTGDTVGATILSTSSTSDYSFLQLSSAPTTADGVATYLGWSSTAIANTNNAGLYRISHPQGSPQAYSEGVVDTTKGTCRTLARGNFIYSRDTVGATEGGSSGSPVLNASGQIVGQLYGACGTNLNDVCDSASNATVDGAFAVTYPNIATWLNPGGGGGGTCSASGQSCTSNSQCCSKKCTGKTGRKTCR